VLCSGRHFSWCSVCVCRISAYRLSSCYQSRISQWLNTVNNNFKTLTISRIRTAPFAYLNSLAMVATCLTQIQGLFYLIIFEGTFLFFAAVSSVDKISLFSTTVLILSFLSALFYEHWKQWANSCFFFSAVLKSFHGVQIPRQNLEQGKVCRHCEQMLVRPSVPHWLQKYLQVAV
jgi:hypothetical protein